MPGEDFYNILGVSKNASTDEIKKAFKRKAVELHPDKTEGDKAKEEQFKKINEAYSVLSDPKKKDMYDKFGTVDENMMHGPGGVDLNDILGGMFGMHMGGGPGGPGQMPGGFQFVFMNDGMPGGGPPDDDIFSQFFGPRTHQRRQQSSDNITVPVDINDIYYGKTKKLEFEMLEQCGKCNGTGAQDPSTVIKCITCNGEGFIIQQMGPFVQKHMCPSCSGNGSTIKNNKVCHSCKGSKTTYAKKIFELRLPKGIPHNHEVRMEAKGGYDVQMKKNKDIVIRFAHDIKAPYTLDPSTCDVKYSTTITIEELLGGFEKTIKLYDEDYTIRSDRYFNPNKPLIVKNMGVFNMKKGRSADLHLQFKVDFTDGEKLIKYYDVFHKIFKKKTTTNASDNDTEEKKGNVIDIQSLSK